MAEAAGAAVGLGIVFFLGYGAVVAVAEEEHRILPIPLGAPPALPMVPALRGLELPEPQALFPRRAVGDSEEVLVESLLEVVAMEAHGVLMEPLEPLAMFRGSL